VRAPVVGHDDDSPFGQGGRDSDDRTWALFQHDVEGGIRLLLGCKVKKGVLPEHDEVRVLGLQENMLGWEPGILEELACDTCCGTPLCTVLRELLDFLASVRQQGGIMVHLVGASPKRHGLGLADGGGIDNPQTDEHGSRGLRPSDTKFHCRGTVCGTIEPN
jgi:hypothetical protein